MKDWLATTLGKQVTLQRGFDITKSEHKPGNVPVISSGGLSGYHNAAMAKGPGVVTGRKGTLGTVFYLEEDYWPHDTTLWVKDFHGNNPRFVYYFLHKLDLRQFDVGSANPTLNRNHIHPLNVLWPPLPIQQRIAEILGRLDDKIEVNRRINRTLEAMAQALYQHWFVDFGPFQDGEFVESELGPIPVGWRVGKLGDLARVEKNTVDPQELCLGTPYIGLADMPKGSITLDTWGQTEDSTSTKFRMQAGQILFGKLRPYFKKVGISPVDDGCSTDIFVDVPKQPEYFSFILTQLIQQDFIDYTEAVSDGTRMPRVNWTMMAKYPVTMPDRAVFAKFNQIIKPWTEIIIKSVAENQQLAAIRNYLLPKLLSGEVPVHVAEEIIP